MNIKKILFLPVLLFIFSGAVKADVQKPVSIGTYSNGCFAGGAKIPVSGDGYELVRLERKRYFGNPKMIAFIKGLAQDFSKLTGKKILVSDISKEHGGPMIGGHASHQIGLDADFWNTFISNKYKLTEAQRDKLQPNEIVNRDGKTLTKYWGTENEMLILKAASNPNVDRIFVNPAIKLQFCSKYPEDKVQYKIRPWWGHDKHFHVRLKCPENDSECKASPALDKSDNGCNQDKLAWWFSKEALDELAKKKPHEPKTLPLACQKILGMKQF